MHVNASVYMFVCMCALVYNMSMCMFKRLLTDFNRLTSNHPKYIFCVVKRNTRNVFRRNTNPLLTVIKFYCFKVLFLNVTLPSDVKSNDETRKQMPYSRYAYRNQNCNFTTKIQQWSQKCLIWFYSLLDTLLDDINHITNHNKNN